MNKQELLAKMLIEPKELVLKDGTFKKNTEYPVFTNLDTDFYSRFLVHTPVFRRQR